jgi:recombination protein RecA
MLEGILRNRAGHSSHNGHDTEGPGLLMEGENPSESGGGVSETSETLPRESDSKPARASRGRVVAPEVQKEAPRTKESRIAAIQALGQQFDKQFGTTCSLIRLGDRVGVPVPSWGMNLPTLDHYLLQCGGIPKGRIIEIYGPESAGKTTITLDILAQIQQAGGMGAFIDAEHALDPNYAAKLGVNLDDLFISQPDNGEQALQVADGLVQSRAVDVIVIDSVSALVPQAELNGEIGDAHVGLQARLMSQGLRILTAAAARNLVTIIFINQIREKIGVMFGCFNYSSRVVLSDGTTEKIGKIVNQKMPVEVLSYNERTGKVSAQRVVNWHDNGNTESFLQIETTNGLGGSGKSKFGVTPNHVIFTPDGGKAAEELKVGDKVVSLALSTFSDLQMEVAVGSILGDGSVRCVGEHNTTLRIRHGKGQTDYAKYKAQLFGNMLTDAGVGSNGSWGFSTAASNDLTQLRKYCYQDKKRRIAPDLTDKLTLHGVAIWYMDDGTFGGAYKKWGNGKCSISAKSYSLEDLGLLADTLERIGLPRPLISKSRNLEWYGEKCLQFQSSIAEYVHTSMDYKLHPSLRGKFVGPEERAERLYVNPSYVTTESVITNIYQKPRTKSMRRFDITVEDNHTYFVDGVAVHNSPETTSGGRALRFFASVRIDVRKTGYIKEGGGIFTKAGDAVAIGNRMKLRMVKNKVGAPFREAEIDLIYETGIDRYGDMVDFGVRLGVIDKSGSWLSYNGERLGQGKMNAAEIVRANPNLQSQIIADIYGKLNEPKDKK